MVITELNVTSTRPLGLGSKLFLSNMPRMLNKDLMQSLLMTTPKSSRVSAGSREGGGGGGGLPKNTFSALRASIWSKIKRGRGPGPRAPPLDPPLRVKKGSAASVKTTEQVV